MRAAGREFAELPDALRGRLDQHRVALGAIVSKYIGETEKDLEHVFNAADHAEVNLFFDEADALFGKRTDIKHAHDRYAGLEGSPLVARLRALFGASDKWPP